MRRESQAPPYPPAYAPFLQAGYKRKAKRREEEEDQGSTRSALTRSAHVGSLRRFSITRPSAPHISTDRLTAQSNALRAGRERFAAPANYCGHTPRHLRRTAPPPVCALTADQTCIRCRLPIRCRASRQTGRPLFASQPPAHEGREAGKIVTHPHAVKARAVFAAQISALKP